MNCNLFFFSFTEEYFVHEIVILLNPLFMNKDLSHPGIKTFKHVLTINTLLSRLLFSPRFSTSFVHSSVFLSSAFLEGFGSEEEGG